MLSGSLHPNKIGYSFIKDAIFYAMQPLFGTPPQPAYLKVANMTPSSIDLVWKPTGVEDEYELRYHTAQNTAWTTVHQRWNAPGYSVPAPIAGQIYYFELRACNNSIASTPQCSFPAAQSILYQTPAAPTNLTATAGLYGNSMRLQWTDNSSNEARFEIEGKNVITGAWSYLAQTASNTTTWTTTWNIRISPPNIAYHVRACVFGLCSGYSNDAP